MLQTLWDESETLERMNDINFPLRKAESGGTLGLLYPPPHGCWPCLCPGLGCFLPRLSLAPAPGQAQAELINVPRLSMPANGSVVTPRPGLETRVGLILTLPAVILTPAPSPPRAFSDPPSSLLSVHGRQPDPSRHPLPGFSINPARVFPPPPSGSRSRGKGLPLMLLPAPGSATPPTLGRESQLRAATTPSSPHLPRLAASFTLPLWDDPFICLITWLTFALLHPARGCNGDGGSVKGQLFWFTFVSSYTQRDS